MLSPAFVLNKYFCVGQINYGISIDYVKKKQKIQIC